MIVVLTRLRSLVERAANLFRTGCRYSSQRIVRDFKEGEGCPQANAQPKTCHLVGFRGQCYRILHAWPIYPVLGHNSQQQHRLSSLTRDDCQHEVCHFAVCSRLTPSPSPSGVLKIPKGMFPMGKGESAGTSKGYLGPILFCVAKSAGIQRSHRCS